jgi:hypothetical protein
MAEILGITAFNTGALLKEWWEWVLVAIIGASGIIGVIAFLCASYKSIRRLLRVRTATIAPFPCDSHASWQINVENPPLPRSVQERIHLLSKTASSIRPQQVLPPKPSSFGVYLGLLNTPVSDEEGRILSQWDTVILDYCEPGVLEAVGDDSIPLGPRIIARLDLLQVLNFPAIDNEVDMLRAVYHVSKVIQQTLRQPDQRRYFTGVLLAGWRERLSTSLLEGLSKLFSAHGLDVFLEIGPPSFLDGLRNFSLKQFAGVVVRNGTVLQNGERRDFFDMDKMKGTTKAFVSESCMRPFTVMMWDTVDDDAGLSHAVARRAHMWCSYHGAMFFLARKNALTDMSRVDPCEEPLAAFQWLKNRKVMAVHEKFRTTRIVSLPETIFSVTNPC